MTKITKAERASELLNKLIESLYMVCDYDENTFVSILKHSKFEDEEIENALEYIGVTVK